MILMLIVIGIGVYQGGLNMPLSMGYYSPPAAIFMQDRAADVLVFGWVCYNNGTYAEGISVRLFATDQLIEDVVITDSEGFFVSSTYFNAGQILTIVVNEDYTKRYSIFINYTVDEDYNLGLFLVHELS